MFAEAIDQKFLEIISHVVSVVFEIVRMIEPSDAGSNAGIGTIARLKRSLQYLRLGSL